ncbi:MAG TPA: hypothetical protein VJ418_39140, partial [Streptosporangiaceae bacterium]|nr:hypothetical protein [Streptosporangiaceae bacterium]
MEHAVSARAAAPGARRASRVTAVTLAALALLLLPGSLVLDALTGQNLAENGAQDIIVFASAVTVGLVLAWHRPGNAIGWLLLAGVDVQGVAIDGSVYETVAHRPGYHLPVGPIVWLDTAWFLGIATLPLIILLFPDGAPPSPRWRRVMWSYVVMVGCYLACNYVVVIDAIAGHHTRIDANGVPAVVDHPAGWFAAASAVFIVLLVAYWLSFAAAQVMSWRRSSGERRQQLKWLMAGAVALAVAEVVLQPLSEFGTNLSAATQGVLNTASAVAIAVLPACLGVAILRYRLYDIDRIISRTLAYAIVTGLLVGVYAGLVLLATEVLTLTSPVAVAAATLAT